MEQVPGGRTPITTRLQLAAWSPAPSAVLQIKRAMPRHGALSSTITIARMIVATPDTRPARRSQSRRPEQHNGSWHNRPSQLFAPFAPFARPTVDYWNLAPKFFKIRLGKGRNVLTVHILTGGNMNLAYFDFKQDQ